MKRRLFSMFLALTLVVGMLPAPAFAQETEPTQVTEASTEAPATEAPATEAPAAEPTPAPTEAPVPETTVAPASTEVPAEPASTEDEAVTAVQAMIDALPDVDHMSEEYIDALEEAYSAYEALSAAQQAKITGVEKLEALFNWVNSQVSTLAEDVKEISGEVTWNNQTFTTPVKLTGDTTLTLVGDNKIECDAPLDLNDYNLTIKGTGSLTVIGNGRSKERRLNGAIFDSVYKGTTYGGGTLYIEGGTVTASGGDYNAISVYAVDLKGGNLEANGGSRAGIVCSYLYARSGSLYATGSDCGIDMQTRYAFNLGNLPILASDEKNASKAEMDEGNLSDIENNAKKKTYYIGEVTGPMLSVKAQKGYLYEGTADQTATFSYSAKNLDGCMFGVEWTGAHPGLTADFSENVDQTIIVTTENTVKQGTYELKLIARDAENVNTLATKTVTVTVLGAPITVTTQPKDASASCKGGDLDSWQGDDKVSVTATLATGLTDPITYQWKLEGDTELDGFNQSTISLKNLYSDKKLTPQTDKPWLSSAKVYCTLTVGSYSVNTDPVTLTVNTCDYKRVDHVDGKCLQCGEFHTSDPLLVNEDGYFAIVPDESGDPSNVGGHLVGGGTFFLTKDVIHRSLNAGNATKDNKDTILDLQGHTLAKLEMGNFPYGSFTLKSGTLDQCVYSNAEGKLILDGVTFGSGCFQATNYNFLEITVQGDSVFQETISFNTALYKPVHLRGGTFEKGIDTSNGVQPLSLLADGFAYQDSQGNIVDASYAGNIDGIKIQVVAHTCKYVNGKCECGRTCDHVGKVNADGYCTVCHALVEPYAIGQTRYKSLESALADAKEGDTITLRGDFYQGAATVEINKSVTLDLGNHTLTGDADAKPVLLILAENVTIQNGTVENTRTAKSSPAVTVGETVAAAKAGLTVKSVTFIGSSDGNAPQEDALDIQNGHAKVESGTFNGGIFAQGSLTMTGGSATRLELGYVMEKVELSGGSFDSISFNANPNYLGLLADGYAYKSNGVLVKLADMDSNTAVQIVKCTHPDGLTATNECPYCGKKCGHGNIDQTTGLCPECGYQKAASLTVDGTTTFFNTFRDAAIEANGKTGALLTLLKDEVMQDTSSLTFGGGKITIDWNGHTLSGQPTNWNTVIALYEAELTLRDSSGNNAGVIYNQNADAIWVCGDGSLTIESGTYASRVFIPVGTATVKISGGIFKNNPLSTYDYAIDTGDSRCLAELMAPGYTLALDSKGRSLYDVYANKKTPEHTTVYVVPHASHNFDESGKCACGATAPVQVVAGTDSSYFGDFESAVNQAKTMSGSTVRLLKDVTLSGDSSIYIEGGTFTIDWNGHTLSGSFWGNLLTISGPANVTLTDSSNTNTGGVRHTGYGAAVSFAVGSEGSVNIQGGTYSPNVTRSQYSYGSVQISGGVFENTEGDGQTFALYDLGDRPLSQMLAPGTAFAYEADGSDLLDAYNANKPDNYRTVYAVAHPTHELDDDTDTCACGFHCDHKDVGDDGVCAACGSQMAASVTAGDGSVTYYRNIAGAIAAATASPGITVTLLNDIDETITNDGMDFVLDLNGKTLAGLELKGYHFALMDSQQTGTIEQLYSDYHGYIYLKEGWCLVDADGMSLNLLTRLDTSGPIRVVHAGVVDIERSKWGTVSYGKQTIPFSLRFRLEDGLKVSSVKVSWTYEVAVREPIGSVQTLTKDEDGFYTFDTSKPLDEHPLNYGRLRAELTHVLLSQIELELEDGQTRRIVLSGYFIRTEKADLSDAVITLDSTALTYAPNPQTAVGQEQTKTVTSVTLYGNTLTEGTDYEVTGNVGTDAGTYTLTVKAKADSKFYTGSKTVTWEIKPLPIEDMMFSGQNKLYDGTANVNPLRCEYLTTKDSQLIYGIQAGADYNVVSVSDYNSPDVHDGDLLAVTVEFPGNYVGLDGTNRMELTVIGQITPAEAPAQGGVTVTVTNGNVATYTVENLDMALSDLTAPCTYGTITYGTPTVEIKDKSYTMTAEIVGAGLKLNVTGTGNTEGRVAVVTVPVQTSNYRDFTLTVYVEAKNKTVPQVKAVGTTEICYGQKLEESRVLSSQVYEPDSETTVPGSFRWEEPETLLDAGTHPMKMIFTPEDTSKYAQTTAMVNVTVNPRPVTLNGVTVADKIYDGTAEATVKDKGTFSNAVSGDTMDYTVTAVFEDKNVAAGGEKTAYLSVTLNGDTGKNYTLAEDSQKEARARMFPKEVNITGGFTAQERDYEPDNPSVQIIQGEVTFDKKAEGDDLGAQVSGGTVATPDAGQNRTVAYSATLTGKDKDNYTLGSVPELTVTIRPIAQTLAFAEAAVTKTYGDSPFVNALTHSVGDGQITYTSSDPAVATVGTDGTVTILKSGTAKITAEAGATQNYVKTSASFDLTVAKAPGTLVNKDYPTQFTYGETVPTPKAENFTTNNPDGTFSYHWKTGQNPGLEPGANPVDAGTYILYATWTGGTNYTTASLSLAVTIQKAAQTADIAVVDETISGKGDGGVTLKPSAEGYEIRKKGETTFEPISASQGETFQTLTTGVTYEIRLAETENYLPSDIQEVTVKPGRKLTLTLPTKQEGYTLTANKTQLDWHEDVELTFQLKPVGAYKTADFGIWAEAGSEKTKLTFGNDGAVKLTAPEKDITITVTGVKTDDREPTASIEGREITGDVTHIRWNGFDDNPADDFVNGDFVISATDRGSGVASIWYCLSQTPLTLEELKEMNGAFWVRQDKVSITEDGVYYLYVKALDKANNAGYACTGKLVKESNPPTFSGVKDGETYYVSQQLEIHDDGMPDWYTQVGGIGTVPNGGNENPVKQRLVGNCDATYTIKAADRCGNEATITVHMKPLSELTKPIDDIQAETIQKSDRATLDEVEATLKGLDVTYAFEQEKKEIQDKLAEIARLRAVLDQVAKVEAQIDALPDSVEPYQQTVEDTQIKPARKAYSDLTDHQKTLVDSTKLDKLGKLEDQLNAWTITEGDGQTWYKGSWNPLSFTVNGQTRKFSKVLLDGRMYITATPSFLAVSGSTDEPFTLTLKPEFLQVSMEPGEHTLTVIYGENNSRTGTVTFTVEIPANYLDVTNKPEFDGKTTVTVDGAEYPIEEMNGTRYVNLPETGDLLTIYSFKDGTQEGSYTNYPTGMQVFHITRQEGGAKAEEITEFANLLNYAGCSIRVSGKKGIRMITGIDQDVKKSLVSKAGLAGYTLEEYGTVVQWADTLGSNTLNLDNSTKHSYAYKKGKADPIFAKENGMIQYTNVLVGFTDAQCEPDLVMRPYIKLKDIATGETVTLYGGCVTRSIGYVAWQNRDTYKQGTASYKYVWNIINSVDPTKYPN